MEDPQHPAMTALTFGFGENHPACLIGMPMRLVEQLGVPGKSGAFQESRLNPQKQAGLPNIYLNCKRPGGLSITHIFGFSVSHMFSTHRQNRCHALLLSLPNHNSAKPGKSMRDLLVILADHYGECKSDDARIRALQNDLKYLREQSEITCDPPSGEGTTLRYRRAPQEPLPTGNLNLDELYQDLIQRGISTDLAADFLQRVQHPTTYFDLPPEQFVSVPDTVRLNPVRPPDPTIQTEILTALRENRVLKAVYRKPDSVQASDRRLHPLGILVRGPQHYLIAYDEKDLGRESPPAKMFLIHRLEDTAALEAAAKVPPGVTVADLVRKKGLADFVRDPTLVTVRLRVWDYVLRLLEDNQLAPNQTFEREENGESAIVAARVMQSGTLYRWLLGFGDKVEVLEPESLRGAIAWQAASVTDYYEDIYGEGEDSDDDEEE